MPKRDPARHAFGRTLLISMMFLSMGCSNDEMELLNRLNQTVTLEVRAPLATLTGGCELPFESRFCRDQFEQIGVIDIEPEQERFLTLSDGSGADQCTRLLWLRLVRLGEVGPVDDPGTLIQLPAVAEIEVGAGALHSVAFPQMTVRIDELGALDDNQAMPPQPCE